MIVYTRIYNGVVNTTAEEPYTGNCDEDYWIEHDDSIVYNIGQVYIKPVPPPKSTSWQVTTMDDQPINYQTATNNNQGTDQVAAIAQPI